MPKSHNWHLPEQSLVGVVASLPQGIPYVTLLPYAYIAHILLLSIENNKTKHRRD